MNRLGEACAIHSDHNKLSESSVLHQMKSLVDNNVGNSLPGTLLSSVRWEWVGQSEDPFGGIKSSPLYTSLRSTAHRCSDSLRLDEASERCQKEDNESAGQKTETMKQERVILVSITAYYCQAFGLGAHVTSQILDAEGNISPMNICELERAVLSAHRLYKSLPPPFTIEEHVDGVPALRLHTCTTETLVTTASSKNCVGMPVATFSPLQLFLCNVCGVFFVH
mmetsp:Transcript_39060/g.100086  ORF Transcript_39060/g.100086 Transcript_39060/m.100086 type:complete len:223 (-) Transcript_39060:34-702(-)